MLVSEIKKAIESYDSKQKDKIIIELYKRIPKGRREYYDIDDFIINLNKNEEEKEKAKTLEELLKEIKYFIDCANKGLYANPNKIISKTDRSKWRFKAKKYYKELIKVSVDTNEGVLATNLLIELYKILSIGTSTLKFSSWNTFGAIGVSQSKFIETILKRKFSNGYTKENIKECANLLKLEFDPSEYHLSVLTTFISSFNTVDTKYMAIEALDNCLKELKGNLKTLEKYSHEIYNLKEHINYFVECIIYIYFNLHEIDNGIKYFHKNYMENNKEVKEYILLDCLESYELNKAWIKEYEKHLGEFDYRENLKEKYKTLKQKKNL